MKTNRAMTMTNLRSEAAERAVMNGLALGRAVAWLTVALLIVAAGPAARGAAPVPIANPGFEDPALADGVWQDTIPGWSHGKYDVLAPTVWVAGASGAGVYDVSTAEYAGGAAPEGENMAFTTSAAGFDTGISQILRATLQADARYDLSVKVGNPYLYNQGLTADYRIELAAGGVVLASTNGPSPADDTTFTTASLTYTSDAAPAQLGQPLEIRLLAVNFTDDYQLDYDSVALDATYAHPVAAPGGPYEVTPGGSLSLDGSGSLPSDGSTLTAYDWDLNNDGTFGDVAGATPAPISYADLTTTWGLTNGPNTIRLRVTDASAQTATGLTTVTLGAEPTTTITGAADGPGGADDNWNNAANWNNGIPSGAMSAVVAAGVVAQTDNAATPLYTGTLTLDANSTLSMAGAAGCENAVKTVSGITMNAGSKIQVNVNANITFPPMTMAGDVSLWSLWGASDHQTDNFGAITGPHTLTISGFNNHTYNLNAANSFTSLVCNPIDRYTVRAKAAGALGTGDVAVNKRATDDRGAVLVIDVADAMADTATLSLNGKGWNNSNGGAWPGTSYALLMNANDTIARLIVDGVEQEAGTYPGGSASWIGGAGVLTVKGTAPLTGAILVVR